MQTQAESRWYDQAIASIVFLDTILFEFKIWLMSQHLNEV